MKLYDTKWYIRLYLWCRDTWNTFRDDNDWDVRHNLCLFIRSIFVLAPLAIFSQLALLASAGYVLVYYPVTRIGWTGFVWEVVVVVALFCVYYFFHLIRKAYNFVKKVLKGRHERALIKLGTTKHDAVEIVSDKKKSEGPSFVDIVFDYLVALKHKTCPTIEIVTSNKEKSS